MTMNADNVNTSIRQHLIDQSVFIGNSSGPISSILMLQWFWLAKTIKRIFADVINQFCSVTRSQQFRCKELHVYALQVSMATA